MHDIFDEFLNAFIDESEEHLTELNDCLIALEQDPKNRGLVDGLFRVMHTLKSSAAAVGLNNLSMLAHAAEDLVQLLRNGQLLPTPEVIDLLFKVSDRCVNFIEAAKAGDDSSSDAKDLLEVLRTLAPDDFQNKSNPQEEINESRIIIPEEVAPSIDQALNDNKKVFEISVSIDPNEPIKWLRAELLINHLLKLGDIIHLDPARETFQTETFSGHFALIYITDQESETIHKTVTIDLVRSKIHAIENSDSNFSSPEKIQTLEEKKVARGEEETSSRNFTSTNSIRVPVNKLDELMHAVGELVVTNSGLKILENRLKEHLTDDTLSHDLNQLIDKLMKVSAGLQRNVLKARMLPLHGTFNQFKRVVRDLAKKEGKEINLVINGADSELDKKVIDAIADPLTHLVRNAVDHGIESPDVRQKAGKATRASIELTASQAGNHILITVKDDGRGIDIDRVKTLAIEKNLLDKTLKDSLSDSDILGVLFEPGFSTAEKVSSVSGRGVGLDVVNNVIGSLNGSVSIQSKPGQGTEFIITLPLTLAISTVIVVESSNNLYGIPISDIRESIKVKKEQIQDRECVKAVQHGNRIIPVIGLQAILDNEEDLIPVDVHGEVRVIIVSYKDRELGLIVDNILGKQEIVLKSLEENYRSVRGLSGAAILGDGNVILVMDILGVIQILKEVELNKNEQPITA